MMDDFTFTWPTKIIFGKGVEKKAGAECAMVLSGSKKKVLLHYGWGASKTGLYGTMVGFLKARKCRLYRAPRGKAQSRLSLVKDGIELCRKEDVGLILAVGGGMS